MQFYCNRFLSDTMFVHELELLQKMDLTAENRQKLETLITEAKKTGKVSSKHLVETLDDVDATQDQTERFYDILEQAGIEIDVSDVQL